MAARTVPTMPNFFSGQKLTGTLLNQVTTVSNFWANPPGFRIYQTVAQSVPNTTDTQITMDTVDYDTDGARLGTTPYNIVIPAGMTGRWQFTWSVACAVNATGSRDAYIRRNGARITGPVTTGAAANNDFTQSVGSTTIYAMAGDVITVYLWQNSGGALNTAVGANNESTFEGRLVSLASP